MKSKKHKNIEVTLLREGIIHIHLKKNSVINLHDAALAVVEMGKISNGKKLPVFIDIGDFCIIDKEVRMFSASEESNIYTVADAIAYSNLGQKLIADFYLNNNNPSVPTKIFAKKKEAIAWLQTFIK